MSVNIANAAIVFSGNTDPLQKSINNVVGALRGFERDLSKVGSVDPTKTMRDGIGKTSADVVKLKSNFAGIAAGFTGAIAGGIANKLIDVANPLDALKGSLNLAGEAEANAMAFEVMTGSVEQAGKVLGDIRQYAKESPFATKDITDATRSMIAMGISADQAVPSVKMLGEVASASGADAPEHLKRLTLAYGQVATAGRLMGTELKQFTEAGVPIVDALADVLQKPKEQIRSLVEDGKVGFPDVVRGFKSITEGAGKFANMSERYSGTFLGKTEQLVDAFQGLGREIGTVVIEEAGLKQMAVDLGSFTDRVRAGTGELRPMVRLVGDVVKGTAQLAYEMGRAAVMIGKIRLEKLADNIPGLSDIPKQIQTVFQDLQDFKFDPVKIAKLGIAFSKSALDGIGLVEKAFSAFGGNLKDTIVDPLIDAAKSIQSLAEKTLQLIDAINAGGKTRVADPNALRNSRLDQAGEELAREQKLRAAGQFGAAPVQGNVATGGIAPVQPPKPKEERQLFKPVVPFLLAELEGIDARIMERARQDKAAQDKAIFDRKFATDIKQMPALAGGLFGAMEASKVETAGSGLLGGLAIAAGDAKLGLLDVAAASKKSAIDLVKIPKATAITKDQLDEADRLKKHFEDPIEKLRRYSNDVAVMVRTKNLSPEIGALAMAEQLKQLGKSEPHRLPNVIEYGSRESTRLEAAAYGGMQSENVQDLLRQIRDVNDLELKQSQAMNLSLMKALAEMGVKVQVSE